MIYRSVEVDWRGGGSVENSLVCAAVPPTVRGGVPNGCIVDDDQRITIRLDWSLPS